MTSDIENQQGTSENEIRINRNGYTNIRQVKSICDSLGPNYGYVFMGGKFFIKERDPNVNSLHEFSVAGGTGPAFELDKPTKQEGKEDFRNTEQ